MSDDALKFALQAYGDQFVRYMLNIQNVTIDEDDFTPNQAAALYTMTEYSRLIPENKSDFTRYYYQQLILGAPPSCILSKEVDDSVATQLRHQCGGSFPDVSSEDPLEAALFSSVRDLFPSLLLPPAPKEFSHIPTAFNPATNCLRSLQNLMYAIIEDTDLRRLFPSARRVTDVRDASFTEIANIMSSIFWLSGTGGGLQLLILPQALVGYALTMTKISGTPTLDACLTHARKGLAAARSLARGEGVDLPVLVGLSNVKFAKDTDELSLPNGKVRQPSPAVLSHLNSRRVSAVLLTTARQQLLDVVDVPRDIAADPDAEVRRLDRLRPQMEEASKILERSINLLRYSMLLGSTSDTMLVPVVEVVTRLSPLELSMGSFSPFTTPVAPFPSVTLDNALIRSIEHWAKHVMNEHPSSLDVGMRRLLSATAIRHDPMDGFIDAVMCWENLFGEAIETGFKVCGSLAMLLEPDSPAKRELLYRRLKKLYTTRSNLVHGSANEPDIQKTYEYRNDAVQIALEAMRRAYDVPGLFDLKKGGDRCLRIMLGFPEPIA